jgi:uncharacterized protein YraI
MHTRNRILLTGLALFAFILSALPGNVVLAQTANGPTLTVSANALNVRQGPGINYPVIDVLHLGDQQAVTGRNADSSWYQVAMTGKPNSQGWVSAAFVQLNGDSASVPVAAAPQPPVASAPAAASASSRSAGNKIVFQTSSGGPIYVVNPNGSGLRYLTHGIDPAISPDGQQVAFTRWDGTGLGVTGSVWVINLDGSGERQVVGGLNQPKAPSWSPDGKQVVINEQHGGRVVIDPKKDCLVAPNGRIVFCRPIDPNWGLTTINMDTGTFQDQVHDAKSFGPSWSPTQPDLVISQGQRGLVQVDLQKGTQSQITNDPSDRAPLFSPDGTQIVESYWQNDHWEIHKMNADGSGAVRLTETPVTVLVDQQLAGQTPHSWDNAAPVWSPDGSQIAFLTNRNGGWEVWIMNADGSNQHPLFPNGMPGGLSVDYQGQSERVMSWR